MHAPPHRSARHLPAIETLLQDPASADALARHGRTAVTGALREAVRTAREALLGGSERPVAPAGLIDEAIRSLDECAAPSLRPVFNLTGTVLHTNLGRSPLPEAAIAAMAAVARGASNLEYDLAKGARGERDAHLEERLCRLTGAEAATVVNNNAAAVLLVLAALASRREVVVSRGELVEIGGSFRIPDVMAAAGARLREVGTTNRTHFEDYADAIGARTGAIMRVHPSNYRIEGFTAAVPDGVLGALAHERHVPFVVDLGSGSLHDLSKYGLPAETTPQAALAAGADLVTFSGDKLLGGPQAGLIVGRRDLVARLKRHPLKRALRCDKLTIAALGAVLALHEAPEHLAERLPALRLLTRPKGDIAAQASRLAGPVGEGLAGVARVSVMDCASQIGSGALPGDLLPSAGLRLAAAGGHSAARLAAAGRALPEPVIGRMEGGALLLDLRCLDREEVFLAQLPLWREALAGEEA